MKEKIKNLIYVDNPSLSAVENLRIKNRSTHEDIIHQAVFNSIDEFARRVIMDLHNAYSAELFNSNQLNIILDEYSIEQLILNSLKDQGHKVTTFNNPEMIYRGFNFVKPSNLLPSISMKLNLIKQKGISTSGQEVNYVINPFFFGFKISLDIFITNLFCSNYSKNLEDGLIKILTDKYGADYKEIYDYVAHIASRFANEGKRKGDQNDETFIAGIQSISGITNPKIFHDFIYESAMLTAHQKIEIFKNHYF